MGWGLPEMLQAVTYPEGLGGPVFSYPSIPFPRWTLVWPALSNMITPESWASHALPSTSLGESGAVSST